MICPHCSRSLKQKERGNRTCQYCHKKFALDPKENPLRLHDLRVKALDEKLSENTYAYTTTQLWYAVLRKRMRPGPRNLFRLTGASARVQILVWLGGLLALVGNVETPVLTGIGLAMVVTGLVLNIPDARRRVGEMPVSKADFQGIALDPWFLVYQADPPHLVRDKKVPALPMPAEPVLAVVCPDTSVLTCLVANQVPDRLHVALVRHVDEVPANAPAVAVLHDASPAGCLLVVKARAQLAPRPVLDLGVRPGAAMANKGALRRRDQPPEPALIEQLRGTLTDAELEWLAQGWWSPVAALRPSILVGRVATAVDRAPTSDPDRRAAAAVGFLTWPGAR
jgi:hypothetical protein